MPGDVLERGRGSEGEGGGLAAPPPASQGPPMVPVEGEPEKKA